MVALSAWMSSVSLLLLPQLSLSFSLTPNVYPDIWQANCQCRPLVDLLSNDASRCFSIFEQFNRCATSQKRHDYTYLC